jgi:cobalt-zinc-cadmium efflux system outer membrane protein
VREEGNVKSRIVHFRNRSAFICVWLLLLLAPLATAQTKLGLRDAVNKALSSRPALRAEQERIAAAKGQEEQSHLLANPTFQFENQNLRPGQTYSRDVDTYAFFTQPLDILGKRGHRVDVASHESASAQADYDLLRRDIVDRVKRAYWAARGAQEIRDVMNATVSNFQGVVDYHNAKFSVGAISEQDLTRVRLESERLKIQASLAALDAVHARVALQQEIGQSNFPDIDLTEPFDSNLSPSPPLDLSQVLAQRVEIKSARADLEEARAKAHLQDAAARPDLTLLFGYKRTQLVESATADNTALAGMQVTVPLFDRNQGNRDAALAEVHRQEQLLAEAENDVRASYTGALAEYNLRRSEVQEALTPLREHSQAVSDIAQQAYQRGGLDLLRLLDAERAQLDGQVTWVQEMVQYQLSLVALQSAEGIE